MEREKFIEILEEGERQAEEMNKIAGIKVAVGLLSLKPKVLQAAYDIRLAVERGCVKDSFLVPRQAYGVAHKLDCNQLEIIAEIRGIEL